MFEIGPELVRPAHLKAQWSEFLFMLFCFELRKVSEITLWCVKCSFYEIDKIYLGTSELKAKQFKDSITTK